MSEYDVVLHFEWVHDSHIHKYLALNKRLREKCNAVMIFNVGGLGVSEKTFLKFKKKDIEGVFLFSVTDAYNWLRKNTYKVYVGCSNGIKGEREAVQIANSKSITVQISDQMGDAGYCKLYSIYSLINSIMQKTSGYGQKKIWLSNCLLWDDIDYCLPYEVSREDFCNKYSLDSSKDIFLWLPDNIQCQKGQAVVAYKLASKIDNVMIKLHPNEQKGCKLKEFHGRWSYELYAEGNPPILDPIDTYWAYKYMSCGFGYTSSIGIEFAFYKKPFVYLDYPNEGNGLPLPYLFLDEVNNTHFGGQFSWVGCTCDSKDLPRFIEEKSYIIKDEKLYNNHINKFLAHPNRKAVDVLTEQLIGLLNNG